MIIYKRRYPRDERRYGRLVWKSEPGEELYEYTKGLAEYVDVLLEGTSENYADALEMVEAYSELADGPLSDFEQKLNVKPVEFPRKKARDEVKVIKEEVFQTMNKLASHAMVISLVLWNKGSALEAKKRTGAN